MIKALILAYDFPPYVSVGALRPYGWYKYLHEYGVDPVIVTRQWDNRFRNHLDYIAPGYASETIFDKSNHGLILKTPFSPNIANRIQLKFGGAKTRYIRKLLSIYYEIMQFVFFTGNKSAIYHAARKYLLHNRADIIIATGDPFILFKYASQLSQLYGIPWIADYRDPWSNDVSIQHSRLLKWWSWFWEKKILRNAKAIITVSGYVKWCVSELHKGKNIYIIPNGYDTAPSLSELNNTGSPRKLLIAFAGTIYHYHPIRNFLAEVSRFLQSNHDAKFQLVFYGINIREELTRMVKTDFINLEKYVVFESKINNERLMDKLAQSDLLLLFNDYYHIGTKVFDYLAARRPMLLCFSGDRESEKLKKKYYKIKPIEGISDHVQEDLIKETNSGYIARDGDHLFELLGKLYEEFTKYGCIKCHTGNIEKYSRKYQTQKLADIIKSLTAKPM